MRTMVEDQYARAKSIITEHREELDRLAHALLEYEMLDREDIDKVIKGIIIETPKKTRSLIRSKKEGAAPDTASEKKEARPEDVKNTLVDVNENKKQPEKGPS